MHTDGIYFANIDMNQRSLTYYRQERYQKTFSSNEGEGGLMKSWINIITVMLLVGLGATRVLATADEVGGL
jgi:hypothetical protein